MAPMNRNDELLESLGAYRPADLGEAAHRDAIATLLRTTANPFSRSQFAPGHITASCYVVDAEGRLLLHHHRRLGRWLQMGGHVERSESPVEAALREAEEESGLRDLTLAVDTIFDVDVHPIPAGKGEPGHQHFDVRYLATTGDAGAIVADANESNELAWVPLAEAERRMDEEAATRVIRKIESFLRQGVCRV